MKKLAFILLILYCFSLFGCSSPVEPTEPTETYEMTGGWYTPPNARSREQFVQLVKQKEDELPENMVMWDDISFLGGIDRVELIEYNDGQYVCYSYWIYARNYYFTLRCFHQGSREYNRRAPQVDDFVPTSISAEMSDMLTVPTDGKPRHVVISRNGFEYFYQFGSLVGIEWKISDVVFQLQYYRHGVWSPPDTEHHEILPNLLSTDDDVAFAAMDEIIDKLSNRQPYVPQETTAESTPAQ